MRCILFHHKLNQQAKVVDQQLPHQLWTDLNLKWMIEPRFAFRMRKVTRLCVLNLQTTQNPISIIVEVHMRLYLRPSSAICTQVSTVEISQFKESSISSNFTVRSESSMSNCKVLTPSITTVLNPIADKNSSPPCLLKSLLWIVLLLSFMIRYLISSAFDIMFMHNFCSSSNKSKISTLEFKSIVREHFSHPEDASSASPVYPPFFIIFQ